jgi:hypothetical protein
MTATSGPVDSPSRAKRRPPVGARRVGYLLGAAINVALIWLVVVSPGWEVVPFLTDGFAAIVGLVVASLAAGLLVNLVYVVADPLWLKRLGDAVTAAFAFAVLWRLVTDFPFAFSAGWAGWETPFRVLLGLACFGTGVAVIANLAEMVRFLAQGTSADDAA